MSTSPQPSGAAKRKRLLKTYVPCPAGYTHDDLEHFLDLMYGLYSYLYTPEELRQIIVSDLFDRTQPPRCLKLVELAAWLVAILHLSRVSGEAVRSLPQFLLQNQPTI